MNEIATKLGEVGLPEPVAALAKREWDAIVVGGGHNGLTAAAYLARAGRSVLVLERRERLGGACTLERPFSDERFVVSPCAYVVGLLDDLVIAELELERRGLRYWMADPTSGCRSRTAPRSASGSTTSRTQANLEELGVSPRDIEGYWAYEELFDEVRRRLRKGERDTWVGDAPSRAEIEELLGGDQTMIDLVFDASIAEVLDEHVSDERLKTALFGQGIIGTWGGPREPGTASIKLMHFQGDMDGQGPLWGYVQGGMGMVSFAIADAAREAGATLACGVEVAEIRPGEGVTLYDGTSIRAATVISNADPKRTLRDARRHDLETGSGTGSRPGRCAARWSSSTRRSTGCRVDGRPGRRLARQGDDRRHRDDRRGAASLRGRGPRRAGGRLRRDLHPDGLRPEPGARGKAPAERLRAVRALRARHGHLGGSDATRSPASSSS